MQLLQWWCVCCGRISRWPFCQGPGWLHLESHQVPERPFPQRLHWLCGRPFRQGPRCYHLAKNQGWDGALGKLQHQRCYHHQHHHQHQQQQQQQQRQQQSQPHEFSLHDPSPLRFLAQCSCRHVIGGRDGGKGLQRKNGHRKLWQHLCQRHTEPWHKLQVGCCEFSPRCFCDISKLPYTLQNICSLLCVPVFCFFSCFFFFSFFADGVCGCSWSSDEPVGFIRN